MIHGKEKSKWSILHIKTSNISLLSFCCKNSPFGNCSKRCRDQNASFEFFKHCVIFCFKRNYRASIFAFSEHSYLSFEKCCASLKSFFVCFGAIKILQNCLENSLWDYSKDDWSPFPALGLLQSAWIADMKTIFKITMFSLTRNVS